MSELNLNQKPLEMDEPIYGAVLKNTKEIEVGDILTVTPTGMSAQITDIKEGSLPSILGWSSTLVFSATDYRIVAWSSGSIILADGTTFTISAGNTGNMSAITYIYLDTAVSSTVLQVSTTASNSVGGNKILIAVAQNNSDTASKAKFQAFGGAGGVLLTVDSIAANSASTNEFITNTAQIKDAVISSAKIGSLNADVINAGTIVGRTLKATGGNGIDTWIENDGYLRFRYGGANKAFMQSDSAGTLVIDADNTLYAAANNSLWLEFNEDGGSDEFRIYNDGNLMFSVKDNGDAKLEGSSATMYFHRYETFDYAEYFESTPEFASEKLPTGTSVVLDNGLVRPAKKNEEPFGVVSKSSFIVSGGAGNPEWIGKHVRDKYGAIVTEKKERWYLTGKEKEKAKAENKAYRGWSDEIPVPKNAKVILKDRPKISPEYDDSKKYVAREDRPEWNNIGLVGRIPLIKGQPTAKNWIKIRNISEEVEEWLVK